MFRRFAQPSPASPMPPRSTDESDAVLLCRVVARDLRAFEALYRSYHPRLERFLGLMTPRRALVEEVLNDTLLVVWNRAHTYNWQCKVSTWIFAIAYRTALKALRTQDEAVEAGDSEDPAAPDEGPEQSLDASERRQALLQALEALSPAQRSAIVLTYFHGLPYAEIARILECPVDTVKTRVFHGRRRLRALLHDVLGEDA